MHNTISILTVGKAHHIVIGKLSCPFLGQSLYLSGLDGMESVFLKKGSGSCKK